MKAAFRAALAAASMLAATQASASSVMVEGIDGMNANALVTPYMTYNTIDQVQTSRTSGYSGVGSLFISFASTATTGFGSICSGALIGSNTVLTAAHCLSRANDPVTNIRFYLPSFGERSLSTTEIFQSTGYAVHSGYATTGLVGGNDIAAFTIQGDTTGHDVYGLYTGTQLGEFTAVGTGTIGGPAGTGIGTTNDYLKREGKNLYEYYGNQIFGAQSSQGVLMYDFDDGTLAHDVWGRIGASVQSGIAGEMSSSPGDSGGPSFINGQIAAVTSFGITGGVYMTGQYCGGNSIDPYNSSGSTAVTLISTGLCTNSSVGEMGGNTSVAYNLNFVQGYLNGSVRQVALTPVPEPATWMMMILGFGAIGGSLRGRRRQTKVAYSMA